MKIFQLKCFIQFAISSLFFLNTAIAQSNSASTTLFKLKGFSQTYFYSPGQEERAKEIAMLMEQAGNFFKEEINFTPTIELYILAPQHWKDIAAKPLQEVYGFPHNIDQVRLAIAAEDNDFWRGFLPPLDLLPQSVVQQVKKSYGQKDGTYSMKNFFDLLAIHEMGHSYTSQAKLKMHRLWMGELFVNIMLHTFIAEKRPEHLPALETFPNMVVSGGTAEYKHTSLEDFEKLYPTMGMGPKNYGWYQSKLHVAAKNIFNQAGKDVLKRLWNALKEHQEDLSDQQFAAMLAKEVHPSVADVYLKWNNELFIGNKNFSYTLNKKIP